jgi:hypothetical protein
MGSDKTAEALALGDSFQLHGDQTAMPLHVPVACTLDASVLLENPDALL